MEFEAFIANDDVVDINATDENDDDVALKEREAYDELTAQIDADDHDDDIDVEVPPATVWAYDAVPARLEEIAYDAVELFG